MKSILSLQLFHRLLLPALCAGAPLLLTGALAQAAGSDPIRSREAAAQGLAEFRTEMFKVQSGANSMIAALDKLASQKEGDLKPAYEDFVREVTNTQALAQQTGYYADNMTTRRDQYFAAWDATLAEIKNPDIRKKSQKRRENVQKSYAKVISGLQSAKAAFVPFLQNLGDIQKYLSADLTASGVKAVRSTVSKAKWDARTVDKHISGVINELTKVEGGLASTAQ